MKNYQNKEYLIQESIKNSKTNVQLAKENNISTFCLEYWIRKHKVYKNKCRYTFNSKKMSSKDKYFWYYVGLIATDGYMYSNHTRNTICLSLVTGGAEKLLNNIKNYFEYTGNITRSLTQKRKNRFTLSISSLNIINEMEKLGIPRLNKTFNLDFPIIFPNENCKRLYFRGIFDGDGSIGLNFNYTKTKYISCNFTFGCASKNFSNSLYNELISLGYSPNFWISNNFYNIKLSRKQSIKFFNWIYKKDLLLLLEDKYNKYKIIKDNDIVYS